MLCFGFMMVIWVVNILLLLILVFYFLCDWDKLVEWVVLMILCNYIVIIINLVCELDEVFGVFICG